MPRFEVYVPAAPPRLPADVALRVESENWLAALKAGLQKVAGADLAPNILCDIQADGSIHVTDSATGRVFRIRELAEAAAAAPVPPPVPPPAPAPRHPAPARVEEVPPPGGPPPGPIGRAARGAGAEDLLAELFERVAEVHSKGREDGLAFLLDLAMEKVGCESGTVFLSRLPRGDLAFAVARGPKAAEIMGLGMTVPVGAGIVGFSVQENVCLAVSDAERDPRFYRAVSEAVGYETRSLLCAPISSAGRVRGALELVNKAGAGPFDRSDLAVLSYLAHQAAELLDRTD